jgi:integrase
MKMQNNGAALNTVKEIGYRLRQLARNANMLEPEDIKNYISTAKTKKTKQLIANETKNRMPMLMTISEANLVQWEKPYYRVEEKAPLIPTRDNVNAIINNASKRFIPIFALLAEIGCSPSELSNITQNDIDKEQGIIRIRGTKGHASGSYKLKQQTAIMLRVYLAENPDEHPFPPSHAIRQVWIDTRHRTAQKLNKPELEQIACRNLRNYSGAQLYLSARAGSTGIKAPESWLKRTRKRLATKALVQTKTPVDTWKCQSKQPRRTCGAPTSSTL